MDESPLWKCLDLLYQLFSWMCFSSRFWFWDQTKDSLLPHCCGHLRWPITLRCVQLETKRMVSSESPCEGFKKWIFHFHLLPPRFKCRSLRCVIGAVSEVSWVCGTFTNTWSWLCSIPWIKTNAFPCIVHIHLDSFSQLYWTFFYAASNKRNCFSTNKIPTYSPEVMKTKQSQVYVGLRVK